LNTLTDDQKKKIIDIYNQYVKEIMNITDISRWTTRRTLSDKVFKAKRTNEQKVLDAIDDSEYTEGDRAYFFFKDDGSLCLLERFDGNYNRDKLLEKLFKTAKTFETVLDVKTLFPNYSLKKNKELLRSI
jgi:hypothetical protein